MESDLLIRQEEVGAERDDDFHSRFREMFNWDVFDPDELLPKRPAMKGSWFCEWTDDCLLPFELVHTYSSTSKIASSLLWIQGAENGSLLVTNENLLKLTIHQQQRIWNKNVFKD